MIHRMRWASGIAVVLLACNTGEPDGRIAPAQKGSAASSEGRDNDCFAAAGPDSTVFTYSDVRTSPETSDESGAQITLVRKGAQWTGSMRIAEGQLGVPRQMDGVRFDPAGGELRFTVVKSWDTARFSGTATCSRLSGAWQTDYPSLPVARDYQRLP